MGVKKRRAFGLGVLEIGFQDFEQMGDRKLLLFKNDLADSGQAVCDRDIPIGLHRAAQMLDAAVKNGASSVDAVVVQDARQQKGAFFAAYVIDELLEGTCEVGKKIGLDAESVEQLLISHHIRAASRLRARKLSSNRVGPVIEGKLQYLGKVDEHVRSSDAFAGEHIFPAAEEGILFGGFAGYVHRFHDGADIDVVIV